MNKRLFFTCLSFTYCFLLSAQTASWTWAKQGRAGGSNNYIPAIGIAMDGKGDLSICGHFSDTLFLKDSVFVPTPTYYGGYVAKYMASGTFKWAKQIKSNFYVFCESTAGDKSGNLYVTGVCYDVISIGGVSSGVPAGASDFFLAKLDKDGNTLWIKTGGGSNYDGVKDLKVDKSGNAYIYATYRGSCTLGTTTLTDAGSSNPSGILAKYNSAGVLQWAKDFEVSGPVATVSPSSICLDATGNCFLTGVFSTNLDFGSSLLSTQIGNTSGFIAKYKKNGDFSWAVNTGEIIGGDMTDIGVDNSGNIYTTGSFGNYFSGLAHFGAFTLTTSGYDNEVFIAKFNNIGTALWARKGGGSSSYESSFGIAINPNGDAYITGSMWQSAVFGSVTITAAHPGNDNAFVVKYNSSGDAIWGKIADGADLSVGYDIVSDTATGDVYTSGNFSDKAYFDGIVLKKGGIFSSSPFIAKITETALFDKQPSVTNTKQSDKNNLVLYPNPVINQLSISINKQADYSIEIINMTGEKLYISKIPRNEKLVSIPVSWLAPGTYILKLSGNGETINKKFIKN